MQKILLHKKALMILGVLLLVIFMVFSLLQRFAINNIIRTKIDISATVYQDDLEVSVAQNIAYKNLSSDPLQELYFHLYPNAYLTQGTAPFEPSDWKAAYPHGFSKGGVEILDLSVGGLPATYTVEGTILKVALPSSLAPSSVMDVQIDYILTLPDSRGRFGAGPHSINLLNAFVMPAVYDQTGWHTDPYYQIGDPFFSDTADYHVELTAPQSMTLASTGMLEQQKREEGMIQYTMVAPRVRDFAAVLSSYFVSRETTVGNVRVVSHAQTAEFAEKTLAYAAQAVASYTSLFGQSVYPEIEVCAADFFIGGMEYPGLAVVDWQLYDQKTEDLLEYVVAHEIAHQWWYGAVGNDEYTSPWLDEALTEYSTLLYFENTYGQEKFQQAYRQFIRPYLTYQGLASIPIEQSVSDFQSGYEYTAVVYAKGAAMWHSLRQEMGDQQFFNALSTYYQSNLHKNATKASLYAVLGEDWSALMETWLEGSAP